MLPSSLRAKLSRERRQKELERLREERKEFDNLARSAVHIIRDATMMIRLSSPGRADEWEEHANVLMDFVSEI